MKSLRMHRLLTAFMVVAVFLAGTAEAQTFPARPITMIVPFAAGGPTDTYARIVGEQMSRVLGQQVLIENVAGAGGTTGITRGSQAKPDGYTIMMGHMGTHGSALALYPKLRYNPVTDFAPIGMAATAPIVIVARKDFPARDLRELVAYLKANPGKINIAHAGVGSVSFTSCTVFTALLGIRPAQVAYRGTGPALTDMMAGQIDLLCDQIVNYVEQVRGGVIKAYAIASPERSPVLPEVPTTTEAGLPAYQITAWSALFAPKGTPTAIVARLSAALDQSLEDPGVKRRLEELGGVVPPKIERTPAWLGGFVREEVERLTPIMKAAGAAGE